MNLKKIKLDAKKILMEAWPLPGSVAVNPLWQLRDQKFDRVLYDNSLDIFDLSYYRDQWIKNLITQKDLEDAKEYLGSDIPISDIDSFFSHHQIYCNSQKKKPSILYSYQVNEFEFQPTKDWIRIILYSTLRDYFYNVTDKNHLLQFWKKSKYYISVDHDFIFHMSEDKAIHHALKSLEIPAEMTKYYFHEIYSHVYGFSSFLYWIEKHNDNPWIQVNAKCENILLIWLALELHVFRSTKQKYIPINISKEKNEIQAFKSKYLIHTAYEFNYIRKLKNQLKLDSKLADESVEAQFIFCIDTRSEGLRRYIEQVGNYETFACAGFFGVFFKLESPDKTTYQSPALLNPVKIIKSIEKKSMVQKIIYNIQKTIEDIKSQINAPFALFETIGLWFSLFMLIKTFMPKKQAPIQKEIIDSYDIDEATSAAYNFLNTIGMTSSFAHNIFICGHQSDTVNNPFAASLNCGACGGNSGLTNSILMSKMLNNPSVREKLSTRGISIPETTIFIPACHHTTNDRVEIISDLKFEKISNDLQKACERLLNEKRQNLPGQYKSSRRELDWSELIPELALVNNAAFIIGPRKYTRGINLQRRAFLHSYDPEQDDNGDILAGLLSAPGIVCHWINAQYFFSTTNPNIFGAGNKAIHNVLPDIGVIEGNISDLKVGLPLQSVYFLDKPLHDARRLVVFVYAPEEILTKALTKAPEFKCLVDNHWLHLRRMEISDAYK